MQSGTYVTLLNFFVSKIAKLKLKQKTQEPFQVKIYIQQVVISIIVHYLHYGKTTFSAVPVAEFPLGLSYFAEI